MLIDHKVGGVPFEVVLIFIIFVGFIGGIQRTLNCPKCSALHTEPMFCSILLLNQFHGIFNHPVFLQYFVLESSTDNVVRHNPAPIINSARIIKLLPIEEPTGVGSNMEPKCLMGGSPQEN